VTHEEAGSSSTQTGSSSVNTAPGSVVHVQNINELNTQFVSEFLSQCVDSCKRQNIPDEQEMLDFIQVKISKMGKLDREKVTTFESEHEAIWSNMQKKAWEKFAPTTRVSLPRVAGGSAEQKARLNTPVSSVGNALNILGVVGEIEEKKLEIKTIRSEIKNMSTHIVSDSEALRVLQLKYNEIERAHRELKKTYNELYENTQTLALAAYELNVGASKIFGCVDEMLKSTDFIVKMQTVSDLTTKKSSDDDG
jgi:hypothetical protein